LSALVTYASCKSLYYDENKTHTHTHARARTHTHTQIKINIERGIETKIMI